MPVSLRLSWRVFYPVTIRCFFGYFDDLGWFHGRSICRLATSRRQAALTRVSLTRVGQP